ncbi:VOC family protein [Cryptosporangium arvum]|uniref:VOC family protein n=1 Tax=Cryptosporangium arvum TaxID=80871 RepID=UPI0004AFF9FF|nr:VOC family protein [Cryptosporangium arvum]
MALRLVQFNLKARDHAALGRFWAAALGWAVFSGHGTSVRPPGTGWPVPDLVVLDLIPVEDPTTVHDRAHLELATTSAEHHTTLVAHLQTLGATPTAHTHPGATVLADPEGNVFCVRGPGARPGTGPIAAVVVDCADPHRLAHFWSEALGRPADTGADHARLTGGPGPDLEFTRRSHVGDTPNRLHLDLLPDPLHGQAPEVTRLHTLGATPLDVGQPADVPWTVLADPEGNEFCVLGPA